MILSLVFPSQRGLCGERVVVASVNGSRTAMILKRRDMPGTSSRKGSSATWQIAIQVIRYAGLHVIGWY